MEFVVLRYLPMIFIYILLLLMLALFLIITLAAAQNCPYCRYDSCQTTWTGFSNCSACDYGALATVELYSNITLGIPQIIGVCQPCPNGCANCSFSILSPAMSPSFLAINCTNCLSGYSYNWSSGACAACPANCGACECEGDTCWMTYCTTCLTSYTLNQSAFPPTCVANNVGSTQQDPNGDSNQNSNGLIIGLSIWGGIMTIIAVIFFVKYIKQGKAKDSAPVLVGLTELTPHETSV